LTQTRRSEISRVRRVSKRLSPCHWRRHLHINYIPLWSSPSKGFTWTKFT